MHADAFCRRNGVTFYSPTFTEKYCPQFPNLPASPKTPYLVKKLFYNRFYKKLNPKCIIGFTDEKQIPKYREQIKKNFLVNFCWGWFFNNDIYREEDIRHYQKIFEPKVDKNYLNETYLKKNDREKIITVHVRRGDYKEFLDGQYYFEDDLYIKKIKEFINVIPEGKYKILICTNDENFDLERYKNEFGNIIQSKEGPVEDQYLMSRTDYILGAPSTFSQWASVMGEVPYYHLYHPEETITEDKIIKEIRGYKYKTK
ncbi:MAG: hypothetical protein DI529_13885 [Chryseobacterium sp.]|nr:MAG: hypothetical protein DI529_13885 [Chryseobacterium sp.]